MHTYMHSPYTHAHSYTHALILIGTYTKHAFTETLTHTYTHTPTYTLSSFSQT